jgi:hypothetical protein
MPLSEYSGVFLYTFVYHQGIKGIEKLVFSNGMKAPVLMREVRILGKPY